MNCWTELRKKVTMIAHSRVCTLHLWKVICWSFEVGVDILVRCRRSVVPRPRGWAWRSPGGGIDPGVGTDTFHDNHGVFCKIPMFSSGAQNRDLSTKLGKILESTQNCWITTRLWSPLKTFVDFLLNFFGWIYLTEISWSGCNSRSWDTVFVYLTRPVPTDEFLSLSHGTDDVARVPRSLPPGGLARKSFSPLRNLMLRIWSRQIGKTCPMAGDDIRKMPRDVM